MLSPLTDLITKLVSIPLTDEELDAFGPSLYNAVKAVREARQRSSTEAELVEIIKQTFDEQARQSKST